MFIANNKREELEVSLKLSYVYACLRGYKYLQMLFFFDLVQMSSLAQTPSHETVRVVIITIIVIDTVAIAVAVCAELPIRMLCFREV